VRNTDRHTHTHTHSEGPLWTSDQPDAENSTFTAHNTHKSQISMPPPEFEPSFPASVDTWRRRRVYGIVWTLCIPYNRRRFVV